MKAYFNETGHLVIEAENITEAVALNYWTFDAADRGTTVRELLDTPMFGLITSFGGHRNPDYKGVSVAIKEQGEL